MNVVFVQFLKGGETGEVGSLEDLDAEIIRPRRRHGFWWTLSDNEKDAVRRGQGRGVLKRVRDLRLNPRIA